MNKKQFFESLVSLLPDNSGQKIDAFNIINNIFSDIKKEFTDASLKRGFEDVEKDILSRVWMFEQICNGYVGVNKDQEIYIGPLIVISLFGEIIFSNKAYCLVSGLTPSEIQLNEKNGTLYSQIYEGTDVKNAQEAISRLHAGKGYKHLELVTMKGHKEISWNSYGGVGGSLEIRSGKEVYSHNNQKQEGERFYRGYIMNTARLLEKLFQVCIHEKLSEENEQYLQWIQELLSMFDFLWNHSDFFLETIDVPSRKTDKIYGSYNTVYAQFLKRTFDETRKFKDILMTVHSMSLSEFLKMRISDGALSTGKYIFHNRNASPVAEVYWQYSIYPYQVLLGYSKVFGVGVLIHKIRKQNIFVRLFRSIFKKQPLDA